MVFGVFIGAWVARYLGPYDYGTLTYYITYIAIFGCIVNLGLDGIVVRDCAADPDHSIDVINNSLFLRFIASILCWAFSNILLAMSVSNNEQIIVGAILSFTLLIQPFETLDLWFQARGQNKKSVYAKLAGFIIANGLKLYIILQEENIYYFCLAVVIESIFTSIAMYRMYVKNNGIIKFKINKGLIIKTIKEAFPFLISNLAILLYMRIDQLFIKEYLGDAGVGQYSVGILFSQFWYFIPVIIATVISPKLAEIKNTSAIKYNEVMRIAFLVFMFMGIAVCLIDIFMAQFLINALYGEKYIDAIKILQIHSITNIFVFMGVAQNIWIVNEKKGHINSLKTMIGLVSAILFNWILIPIFGLVGAAYSAVLTYFITAFLINYILIRKLFYMQIGIIKL